MAEKHMDLRGGFRSGSGGSAIEEANDSSLPSEMLRFDAAATSSPPLVIPGGWRNIRAFWLTENDERGLLRTPSARMRTSLNSTTS